MRIAVDAMGGDFAPGAVVAGTLAAAHRLSGIRKLFLVGQPEAILACVPGGKLPETVEIVSASEVVGMDELPAAAVRRKRDSSIGRAVDLVRAGNADAVFSAGNTGAAVAATTLKLRLLEGVLRPAIATVMPTVRSHPFILIDAGANPECSAEMLVQFAVMGSIYARKVLHIEDPTVGLLSIGGEDTKGNDTTKETFGLLKAAPVNFRGNVEGHDLFEGRAHVVVCDGFVGNVVLKTAESVAHFIGHALKEECTRNPIRMLGALLLRGGLGELREKSDPAQYGGAPLLGVNGVCIIGHGSSSAHAVYNAIRVAGEAIQQGLSQGIATELKGMSGA